MHVGKAKAPTLVFVGEAFVVDAKQAYQGSLKVVNVNWV